MSTPYVLIELRLEGRPRVFTLCEIEELPGLQDWVGSSPNRSFLVALAAKVLVDLLLERPREHFHPHAEPIVYRERMADARRQVDQFLEQFALRCAEAKVACKVVGGARIRCVDDQDVKD